MKGVDRAAQSEHLSNGLSRSLRILHDDYLHYDCARHDIQTHLEATNHALEKNETFLETLDKLDRLDVTPQDINGYTNWQDASQKTCLHCR